MWCNRYLEAKPDHRLVGVLHNQIFSILLGHHQVKDTSETEPYLNIASIEWNSVSLEHRPDYTPGIVHAQVDLLAKLNRLELLGAEDDVP